MSEANHIRRLFVAFKQSGGGFGELSDLIEALALHTIQQMEEKERPAYPEGDVVGPCVCGSWPGGPCLRCEWIPAK